MLNDVEKSAGVNVVNIIWRKKLRSHKKFVHVSGLSPNCRAMIFQAKIYAKMLITLKMALFLFQLNGALYCLSFP